MSLAGHLQSQKTRLEELVDLLREERQLLVAGRVEGDRLAALAGEKQHCLARIEQSEPQPAGTGRADTGLAAREAGCAALWRATQQIAGEAARLNTLNGDLIQLRLTHNQRMLNVLREATSKLPYGPDGQSGRRSGQVYSTV